ncbi:MAG TPA: oligosaccharide flippase family protein [Tepidimicrobium sp.]|nr:oligosaccharide flippase family protein [Tepidimicrobium sp.]
MSNKLIAKNSLFLYIRLIATTIIGLLTSRYTISALGAESFGLFSVVGGVVSMMAFINTIMVATTYRFVAVELGKKDGNVNKIFNTSLSIHIAIALIVVLLSITVGIYYISNYMNLPEGRLNDALYVFVIAIISTVMMIIGVPFQGFLVAKEKFSVTVPIEVFSKGLQLVLVILLNYLNGNRLIIYALFILIAHSINPLMYAVYSYKAYFKEIRPKLYKDMKQYLEMIKFSGWMAIGAGSSMLEHQGSALIINKFFGTLLNASFGIAGQVRTMVGMFTRSLSQAIVPQISKSYSGGNEKRSKRLVVFASKYSFLLMLIPLVPIMLEIDFMLNLWLTEVPKFTTSFVRIMLIQSLIQSLSSGIPTLIQASGKVAYFTIFTSIAILISLPLAFILYSIGFPPHSISYIYAFTALLNFIVTIYLLKFILKFDTGFFIKEVVARALLVLIVVSPAAIIPFVLREGWIRFFISAIVGELLLFAGIYFVGMEKNEKKMVRQFVINQWNRMFPKYRYEKSFGNH